MAPTVTWWCRCCPRPAADIAVPGESFTFGELFAAQAHGDLAALRAAGKRAVRVNLDELLALAR